MDEATRIIQDLDAARAAMRTAQAQIDPKAEIYPGWTIKHILAHIAGWDDAVIASLRAHLAGQDLLIPATEAINDYNAASVATREALSLSQVEREWEMARSQVKDLLAAMPPEKLDEPLLCPWGERGTVDYLLRIFIDHENAHATEIQDLLRRE